MATAYIFTVFAGIAALIALVAYFVGGMSHLLSTRQPALI